MLDFVIEFLGELLSEGLSFLTEHLINKKKKRERKN